MYLAIIYFINRMSWGRRGFRENLKRSRYSKKSIFTQLDPLELRQVHLSSISQTDSTPTLNKHTISGRGENLGIGVENTRVLGARWRMGREGEKRQGGDSRKRLEGGGVQTSTPTYNLANIWLLLWISLEILPLQLGDAEAVWPTIGVRLC